MIYIKDDVIDEIIGILAEGENGELTPLDWYNQTMGHGISRQEHLLTVKMLLDARIVEELPRSPGETRYYRLCPTKDSTLDPFAPGTPSIRQL